MRRKIIEIDESLCDGCGDCAAGCAEGAIQIIEGKARLVREGYCDGLGDCVGACHSGALKVVERDAAAYDARATLENLRATGGAAAVRRFEEAQARHDAPDEAVIIPSELQQWPVQLHLVRPGSPCFRGRELVVMSTCAPLASAEIHRRYLRGRAVVVACPKLDKTEPYAAKLGAILAEPSVPGIIVVIMEVPCCRGLSQLARQGIELSGRDDLAAHEHTLALTGQLRSVRAIR